jgi:hypothetical protein
MGEGIFVGVNQSDIPTAKVIADELTALGLHGVVHTNSERQATDPEFSNTVSIAIGYKPQQ